MLQTLLLYCDNFENLTKKGHFCMAEILQGEINLAADERNCMPHSFHFKLFRALRLPYQQT